MTKAERKNAGVQGGTNSEIRTVLPSPKELATREPNVEVFSNASGVNVVRTPEDRFTELVDCPLAAKYVDIDGLRMAYIDADHISQDNKSEELAEILNQFIANNPKTIHCKELT